MSPFLADRPRQWEVLSSPIRLEIVAQLELYGPSSVAEVAEELGRTPQGLHHHFKKLLDAGIVQVERTRVSGAREEAIYAVPGRPVVLRYADTPSARRFRVKTAASCLRQSQREFEHALELAAQEDEQPEIRRYRMRLDPAAAAKIRRHLDAIVDVVLDERVSAARSGEDTRWFTWTSVLAPLERTSKSEAREAGSRKEVS